MKVEFSFNTIEEFSLGIFCAFGEDELGSCHITQIGLIFFTISLIKYL